MSMYDIFIPRSPAKEIVEVLAKYNTPINMIDAVFDFARSFAHQGTTVQSLERKPVFVPGDSDGVHLNNGPAIACLTIQIQGNAFMDDSILKKTPTCELVKELETREAVQLVWIEPYTPFGISKAEKQIDLDIAEGAAKILVIWD